MRDFVLVLYYMFLMLGVCRKLIIGVLQNVFESLAPKIKKFCAPRMTSPYKSKKLFKIFQNIFFELKLL